MNPSHWDRIYQDRTQVEPRSPQYAEAAAGVKEQLSDFDGRLLLLCVSPLLSHIASDITAVDRNAAVVRYRWPGNTENRRAVIADWRQLPFATGSFAACAGDGSINALGYNDAKLVYDDVARVMISGGRFVCRMFLAPDIGERVSDVAAASWQGKTRSFVQFRFRLGMAIAAERGNPDVPVQLIQEAFDAQFPDRNGLAAATGWNRSEIDRIDFYKDSSEIYNFPTRQQALSAIPRDFENARFVPVGNYELAERCPLLVAERK